jgi:hypothetical protein
MNLTKKQIEQILKMFSGKNALKTVKRHIQSLLFNRLNILLQIINFHL